MKEKKQNTNSDLAGGAYTTAPVSSPTTGSTEDPEFLRLPKPGTLDPKYKLSRSKWNEMILPCPANAFKPPIKSICLRKRGAARGVRLIVAAAAKAYFDALIEEANSPSVKKEQ